MNADSFVKLTNVQKTYDGEKLVIKDLSLSIRRGEFLTLLGPSGSGKTTTLLMLAGFERPTSGQIEIDGRPLTKEPPYKRDLGMVFQDYALFPHMTVYENIAFPLTVRKVTKTEIEEKVRSVLNMVHLGEFGRRYPTQLSGGQQQRVALARALVFQPQIVLMDEPLGALDKQLREQMQLEIKHIQERLGITVIYVTHDQSEALTMSDRIAVFNDGVICQLDTPEDLYEKPQNSFVAQFIGENNQLPGTIVSIGRDSCAVELDGGGVIKALPVGGQGVGSRTLLSVRPERIVISGMGDSLENNFKARIKEIIYKGEHTRIRVELLNGTATLTAKMPVARKELQPRQGEAITIGWPAQDCRALDEPQN